MGFSGDSVVKNPPTNSGDSGSFPESGRSPEKEMATHSRIPPSLLKGFPPGSAWKESTCNVGDLGSIPGLGRSSEEGNSYPLQYSGLENSMDCVLCGITKRWTQLNNFHFQYSYWKNPKDRGAWWATVHRIEKRVQLSD